MPNEPKRPSSELRPVPTPVLSVPYDVDLLYGCHVHKGKTENGYGLAESRVYSKWAHVAVWVITSSMVKAIEPKPTTNSLRSV